jgi:hypothetical protein
MKMWFNLEDRLGRGRFKMIRVLLTVMFMERLAFQL